MLAACLFAIGFWIRLPRTLPSQEDYRAAAGHVAAGFAHGDAVLLYPAWAERGRMFLEVQPVLAVPRPDLEDFTRSRRLWLFGLPDVPRSDFEDMARRMALRYRAAGDARRFGSVSVALYENPGHAEPVFDFRQRVASAQVSLGGDVCPWDGRAHRCRLAPWLYVADELHEIEFQPRRCLWAHPAGPGMPLTVNFPEVILGRSIRVSGGIASQVAWRKDPGWGPVTLDVSIDGKSLGSMTVEAADGTEHTSHLDTSALAGTPRAVTFTVTCDKPGNRHFCFDAAAW